jgi:hypothetical protein
MENKASKAKTSVPVVPVSGGNKIVEKKLNNQVVELTPAPTSTLSQTTKKGNTKKVVDTAPTSTVETKKGGAKKVTDTSVLAATPVVETKKGGAKKVVAATAADVAPVVAAAAPVAVAADVADAAPAAVETKKGGAKKGGAKSATEETKVSGAKKEVITTELETEAQSKLRYFKLFYNNEICGRYCGKKPKQAANKAFSSIVKDMKKDGVVVTSDSQLEVPFTIKECTRNSRHKEYKYIGKRHLLKDPVKVSIENGDGSVKEIVYKFHNQLQKAPKE